MAVQLGMMQDMVAQTGACCSITRGSPSCLEPRALLCLLLAGARQLGLGDRPLCLSLEHPVVQTGGGVSGVAVEVGLQGAADQDIRRISSKVRHEELLGVVETIGCDIGAVEVEAECSCLSWGLLMYQRWLLILLGAMLLRCMCRVGGV